MTGLRRGEALGLRWQDLDLEAQTLQVNQSLEVLRVIRYSPGPKTDARRRMVALDPRTVALVMAAGVPLISFHELRHSHATALLGAGVDLNWRASARAQLGEDHGG